MHCFFVSKEQIGREFIHILGKDVNHIKNVLRMKAGEEISVSDGEGMEYRCFISCLGEEEILAEIKWKSPQNVELPSKIVLFQGLPKADKMELIIQKGVELGVSSIVPVLTQRAVVKLDEKKAKKKTERWQEIAQSGAKQSKRAIIPKVEMPLSFKEALAMAGKLDCILIPYELAEGMKKSREIFSSISPGQSVGIFIGPEGGFSRQEVEEAKAAGAIAITLGRRILRTETAGLTVLAILMYHLERDD